MPLVTHDGISTLGPEFQVGDSAWTNTYGSDDLNYEHVTIAYYRGCPEADVSGFYYYVIPCDPDFVYDPKEINDTSVLDKGRFMRLQSHQLIAEEEFLKLKAASPNTSFPDPTLGSFLFPC